MKNKNCWSQFQLSALAVVGFLYLIQASANAATVYDNGLPDFTASVTGGVSDWGEFQRIDDFILQTGSTSFNSITWYGSYYNGFAYSDDFTIRIFSDNGSGAPSQNSFQQLNLITTPIRSLYQEPTLTYMYSVGISQVDLNPDQQYWLSIFNNRHGLSSYWVWTTSTDQIGNAHFRWGDAFPWSPESKPLGYAFSLANVSAVPLPAAFWLFAAGLIGLLGFMQRGRRK